MAGWNKDYKPAPYPKTEEECLAAAKKYYLLPEEYKPYPDDGFGYGDYPQLEGGLGVEARDPFYPYDFPSMKRNLHEPVSSFSHDSLMCVSACRCIFEFNNPDKHGQ